MSAITDGDHAIAGEPAPLPRALVEERLHDAGFEIEARLERKPYPDIEYQSERAYLRARPRR